jgi:hypothetical protein
VRRVETGHSVSVIPGHGEEIREWFRCKCRSSKAVGYGGPQTEVVWPCRLTGIRWHPRHQLDPAGPRFNAAVYVFCLQTAEQHDSYDQLRLDQWLFYVIPRSTIAQLDQKSIGLPRVKSLSGGATPWDELQTAVRDAADGQELDSDGNWRAHTNTSTHVDDPTL